MMKCVKVWREPLIKALHSMLSLKWGPGSIRIVYASYRRIKLAFLLLETLHKWQRSFFFIHPMSRSWPFSTIWRNAPKLKSFHHRPQLSSKDWELIRIIEGTPKLNLKAEVPQEMLKVASICESLIVLLCIATLTCLPFVIITDMIFYYCFLSTGMQVDIEALWAILAKRKGGSTAKKEQRWIGGYYPYFSCPGG